MVDLSFYKDKKVFITGHTGFKGSWLCKILTSANIDVCGYALEPPTEPSLYNLLNISKDIRSVVGDIRDLSLLQKVINEFRPDIVIHMAAQPLVRISYTQPVSTYEINVMGTVNILEAIRQCSCVRSFINVTTDKVYKNNEWYYGYRENDELNGFDPYSNSKSCSELVTSSYYRAFFKESEIAISTMRAGNVIGGGDFAEDRIIPDCVRAMQKNEPIVVRNPYSIRPYQHVLEPLFAYLLIAKEQYINKTLEDSYNVGPDECDCVTTGKIVDLFCNNFGPDATWLNRHDGGPHEANFLKLDCSKIKSVFGWSPKWNISETMKKTVEWSKTYLSGDDICEITDTQIKSYIE